MKGKHYTLMAGLMLVSFCIGFICGVPTDLEPTVRNETTTNAPVESESEWRGIFINACVAEEATMKQCVCMYDWLRARYTIGEMAQMGVELESEASQLALNGAGIACYKD